MIEAELHRRRVRKPSGRRRTEYRLTLTGSGQITWLTPGWRSNKSEVIRGLDTLESEIRAGQLRRMFLAALLCALTLLTSHLSLAVNSPRPASYRLQDNTLVLTWTNLNTAYPRTLSFRSDLASPWQWETNRLWPDATGTLVVTRPIAAPAMFYRLWPATP